MKYFTPEIYLKLNSKLPKEVEAAHDQWERAIEAYREHLETIGPQLSPRVRQFAETLSLHDAEFEGSAHLPVMDVHSSLGILILRREGTQLYLIYALAQEPLVQEVKHRWPYSKARVHWLYDEFDVDKRGVQQHEILLSNGRIITMRFHELQLLEQELREKVAV